MSQRDESESGGGGFRTPANDDPHGTRSVAMALSPEDKARLGFDRTAQRWVTIAFACVVAVGAAMAIFMPLMGEGAMRVAGTIGMGAVAGTAIETSRTRMFLGRDRLVVIDRDGQERSFAWSQVESFRLDDRDVRAEVRIGRRLEKYVGSIRPTSLPFR